MHDNTNPQDIADDDAPLWGAGEIAQSRSIAPETRRITCWNSS